MSKKWIDADAVTSPRPDPMERLDEEHDEFRIVVSQGPDRCDAGQCSRFAHWHIFSGFTAADAPLNGFACRRHIGKVTQLLLDTGKAIA
jgi:hypothetical protein